ncbi:MAG TPA: hypothetical protein VEJ38_05010 [Candidatus Acidoferrales bacterium]|nr:hypothetical protein [Candidatus Acidoferrales bacterium]
MAVSFEGYAHCPRCGNFDLDHIARDRVGPGLWPTLQRFLGLPAYRCDPCREKFFTLRPYRRIVPSMISVAEEKVASS